MRQKPDPIISESPSEVKIFGFVANYWNWIFDNKRYDINTLEIYIVVFYFWLKKRPYLWDEQNPDHCNRTHTILFVRLANTERWVYQVKLGFSSSLINLFTNRFFLPNHISMMTCTLNLNNGQIDCMTPISFAIKCKLVSTAKDFSFHFDWWRFCRV